MNDIFFTKSFGVIFFIHQSDHIKLVQYFSLPFALRAPEEMVLDPQHVVVLLDVPQADHLLVGAEVD